MDKVIDLAQILCILYVMVSTHPLTFIETMSLVGSIIGIVINSYHGNIATRSIGLMWIGWIWYIFHTTPSVYVMNLVLFGSVIKLMSTELNLNKHLR